MSLGNNKVALDHFLLACVRSFEKSPKLLARTTSIQQDVFIREKGANELKKAKAFQIERNRIDLVMRKIAYAIFFSENGTQWNRNLTVATEHLRVEGMEADVQGKLVQMVKPLLQDLSFKGNNPEVFQRTFVPTESADPNDQVLMMRFYEGFEVWMIPLAGTTSPSLLHS